MAAFLDKTLTVGILAILVITCLAFGTNEAWSLAIFELLVMLLLVGWVSQCIARKRIVIEIPVTTLPVALLFGLGLVQSLATSDGSGRIHSLSMDVEATRGATIVIGFLLIVFLLSATVFARPDRLATAGNFLAIYGMALALFAIFQYFTSNEHMFWLPNKKPGVGPFVNRNHFAGYMEMLVPFAVALAFKRGLQREFRLFYGFAAVLMGLSIFMSLSRGGIISFLATLLFIVTVIWRQDRQRDYPETRREPGASFFRVPRLQKARAIAGALVILAAIGFGINWIGAEGLVNRTIETLGPVSNSETEVNLFARPEVWKDTLKLIQAHAAFGVGLGAYETVFPMVGRNDGSLVVNYSHNDYLQILADAGVAGGIIALLYMFLIGRAMIFALRTFDPALRTIALGGAAGIFSILVHSVFDFNLQIPANVILFLFLSALLSNIAALARRQKPDDLDTLMRFS
jgi:O-antigen ligase